MKKGQRIQKIIINGEHVSVYDTDGNDVKITRTQRHIFKRWKDWNFMDKLSDEFGNSKVLVDDYIIIVDGKMVHGGA